MSQLSAMAWFFPLRGRLIEIGICPSFAPKTVLLRSPIAGPQRHADSPSCSDAKQGARQQRPHRIKGAEHTIGVSGSRPAAFSIVRTKANPLASRWFIFPARTSGHPAALKSPAIDPRSLPVALNTASSATTLRLLLAHLTWNSKRLLGAMAGSYGRGVGHHPAGCPWGCPQTPQH